MPEVGLKLIPGVNAEKTPTLNEAGISSCNLIRFQDGLAQKLGGWLKHYPGTVNGTPREMHAWEDLSGAKHLTVGSGIINNTGTATQLAVITNNVLEDITPQTLITNPSPNFSTVLGSSTVTIIDTEIATVTTSDSVFLNTPVSVGGLILAGTYPITVSGGATQYEIEANATATATVNNGGSVPVFDTTSGSPIVAVTLVAHGLVAGNYFTFPIPTTVGGIVIDGTTKVISVQSADIFSILSSSQATSNDTVSMNGGDAEFLYYLNLGPAAGGVGYGVGPYGAGGYGSGVVSPSQTGTPIVTDDWTLDNWGEILLACPDNGGVYQWQPNSGFTNAGLVATAPIYNTGIFVAMPEQILVCYGSTSGAPQAVSHTTSPEQQDPLMIRWSDSEDFTVFTASSFTQAGSFRIPNGSMIVGGIQGPQQALIFTDLAVWAMSYLGAPLVFGFNELSAGCGLIAKHGVCVMRGAVFWMSNSNFFRLSGRGVENIPCTVWDVVFQDLDTDNQNKICAAPNSTFDEVWFFYPSASGGTGEIDKYVKLNINDGSWDYGNLARSAWVDQSVLGQPIGASPQGLIYQHETGFDNDLQAMTPSFTTGWFVIADGQSMAFVDWLFPDMKFGFYNGAQNASVQITIETTAYPNQTPIVFGPYTMTAAKNFINMRLRGRQIRLTFSSSDLGSFWRLGLPRYRVAMDGRR